MTTRRVLILALALAAFLCATVGLMMGRLQVLRSTPLETSSISIVTTSPRAEGGGTSASSSPLADAGPRISGSPPSTDNADVRSHWGATAEGFAESFTNVHGGKHAWAGRLLPFVTEEVGEYLASVDVSNVPTGRYRQYEVLELGESELAIRVTYREGWSMVLYLITDGTDWKVYRYDRFED